MILHADFMYNCVYKMQWAGLYVAFLALCCLHTSSELHISNLEKGDGERRKRNDEEGLALSREIFKNITKQLRENIKRDGTSDIEKSMASKLDNRRVFQQHHHEHHWGPYFEGDSDRPSQITAHVGSEALLNCRVGMLKDKTVIWLRHAAETAQLLTVGAAPYAGDSRIAVRYQYPNNWRLSIKPAKKQDEGLYMCQISTHPPRAKFVNLTILPPFVTINGDETHEVKDRFYKIGSSIKLSCVISYDYFEFSQKSNLKTTKLTTTTPKTAIPSSTTTLATTTKMSTVFNTIDLVLNRSWSIETTTVTSTVKVSTTSRKTTEPAKPLLIVTTTPITKEENNFYPLTWKKQDNLLKKNVLWQNLSATISVPSASQNDSGTYTCSLGNHSQVSVNVHVLSGENQAAVYHNKGSLFWNQHILLSVLLLLIFVYF